MEKPNQWKIREIDSIFLMSSLGIQEKNHLSVNHVIISFKGAIHKSRGQIFGYF